MNKQKKFQLNTLLTDLYIQIYSEEVHYWKHNAIQLLDEFSNFLFGFFSVQLATNYVYRVKRKYRLFSYGSLAHAP